MGHRNIIDSEAARVDGHNKASSWAGAGACQYELALGKHAAGMEHPPLLSKTIFGDLHATSDTTWKYLAIPQLVAKIPGLPAVNCLFEAPLFDVPGDNVRAYQSIAICGNTHAIPGVIAAIMV